MADIEQLNLFGLGGGEQIMHMRDNANNFAAVYRTLPCNHIGCDGLEFM